MIESIGVVGAGQMGAGIAQVAAQAGLAVSLSDVAESSLDAGKAAIDKSLARLQRKEILSQQQCDDVVARIRWSTDLESHRDKPFVIEAVSEREAVKQSVFSELDPGFEHLVDFDYPVGGNRLGSGTIHRHALHESSSCDEIGGGDPGAGNIRRDLFGDDFVGGTARQRDDALTRLSGIHRQSDSYADDQ